MNILIQTYIKDFKYIKLDDYLKKELKNIIINSNLFSKIYLIYKFIMSSKFVIVSKIGEGSFGSVFKVKRKEDDQIYAMKKVSLFLKRLKLDV